MDINQLRCKQYYSFVGIYRPTFYGLFHYPTMIIQKVYKRTGNNDLNKKTLSHLISKSCLYEAKQNFICLSGLLGFWSVHDAYHIINALRQQGGTLHFHHFSLGLISLFPSLKNIPKTGEKF